MKIFSSINLKENIQITYFKGKKNKVKQNVKQLKQLEKEKKKL